MLPYSENLPAGGAEGASDEAVAGLVGRNLFAPERGVVFRLGRVLGIAVPETSISEDRQLQSEKNKVGFACEF